MKRAYLLAGGQSRRFGSDKARVEVDGIPNLLRIASHLQRRHWTVTVVSQSITDFLDLGLPCIEDPVPYAGPLAGTIAALTHCKISELPYCLIMSCDLVIDQWEWLDAMEERMHGPSTSIVVFDSSDFLPFPALYGTQVLEVAERIWQEGSRSLKDLHRQVEQNIQRLNWPVEQRPFTFNTPEELAALQRFRQN
jgi:molybdenum cofactor guanylyltransferase